MEKPKRWQLYLIVTVIALTLYNILPTIFFYTKPLKQPINAERAHGVSEHIVARVNDLEGQSEAWLASFSKLVGVNPTSIQLRDQDPGKVDVAFKTAKEAMIFRRMLPRSGAMIPFVPAQLQVGGESIRDQEHVVTVQRQIGVHLDPKEIDQLFLFTPRFDAQGVPTAQYRDLVFDRVARMAIGFAGAAPQARQVQDVIGKEKVADKDDVILALAKELTESKKILGSDKDLMKRWYRSFSQVEEKGKDGVSTAFVAQMKALLGRLAASEKSLGSDATNLDGATKAKIQLLQQQQKTLTQAIALVESQASDINSGLAPLTLNEVKQQLNQGFASYDARTKHQTLSLEGRNPFVRGLEIDWGSDQVLLNLYDDVKKTRQGETLTEEAAYRQQTLNSMLIQEIARVSQAADESIQPKQDGYGVTLSQLTDPTGMLLFDLATLAKKETAQVTEQLSKNWNPDYTDLQRANYPIVSYDAYRKLSPEQQRLALVVYAPALQEGTPPEGFQNDSIYVIARGLDDIIRKYRELPTADGNEELTSDFQSLNNLLQHAGFISYPGSSLGVANEFARDYIFRLPNFYSNLIAATRENFQVKGSKRFATLDFTDVEQRILTENRIDDRIQEDLIKWRDEYNAAQVDLNLANRYTVPAPTSNPYIANMILSARKYFRGDDRKVLKWGLDLSGGKTVRIGLRDKNGRAVTNPDDLKQAVNELYTRINKMGVAERTIRVENDNIILDFPGSQGLSASELVKASAMYFHIVNEKFGRQNPELSKTVDQFLQEVWNEAVVTNRQDIESINEIAYRHLGGVSESGVGGMPYGEAARVLISNGLRLANPAERTVSPAFDDSTSYVTMYRGNDFSEWYGQTHPLLIVFNNYALSGANLDNIHVGYDSMEGNLLLFSVKRVHDGSGESAGGSPRDDLYAWTSQFAEDKIAGTAKEKFSGGHGWRMAVILDNAVVSAPSLKAALRDQGSISGRFSQREINQLATDLKAGSLTFTPRILSEHNISPELGKEERQKGIIAAVLALALVITAMIAYYHFGGVVASFAVLFNLLIIWGVLQNLGAALTLPGIAGLVLTMGMAVDANVLVFERIREEFKISGRIGSAIQAGYRKAFSAIFDSNITTIIVAAILIQFDAGPIRGFAVTLIIGIISSMFTALFVTRYYFSRWVQNPKNTKLSMSQFFNLTRFDFLKQTKKALTITAAVLLIGGALFVAQRHNILGMDFTGGYSLTVNLLEKPQETNYRLEVMKALQAAGAQPRDIQVQQLSRPSQLRIQLGTHMEEVGGPFNGLPLSLPEGSYTYAYEGIPRMAWVVNALEKAGLKIQPTELAHLQDNWTVMSGQFSDVMRNNAIIALSLAFLAILIYITFRFEFKFGMAAVIGLVHDVLVTLAVVAILRFLGVPLQIDLAVIGAIMMIIGYSLNDTIIVFDRIREDIRTLRKLSYREVVNHALNVTLSRTVMTSGTTLLVLLSLVIVGGSSIFGFAVVMTIGIVVGTLSSLFIAAPTLLFLHDREINQSKASDRLDIQRRDAI